MNPVTQGSHSGIPTDRDGRDSRGRTSSRLEGSSSTLATENKTMTAGINRAKKALGIAIVAIFAVLFVGATQGVSAQATPEGTVITNEATVNFTDANGNVYAQQAASVDVTVTFLGSLDVTSPAFQTPLSPSSDNVLAFNIANNGNGTDTVNVALTVTDASVTNVQELRYVDAGGDTTVVAFNTDLATTVGDLNTVLGADSIPLGDTVQVLVIYDVGGSQGDNTSLVDLTATSQRTGGDSDVSQTDVTPPTTGDVIVTSNTPSINRLIETVANYSATFDVLNGASTGQNIDLTATVDGSNAAGVTIISVNGTPGSSATGIAFTAAQTQTITVVYQVSNGSGTTTLNLAGVGSTTGLGANDDDDHVVTAISPAITIVKTVHATKGDAQTNTTSTLTPAEAQPGDTIWYRVQITNTGTADAVITGVDDGSTAMEVVDDISSLPVTFVELDDTGTLVPWNTLNNVGNIIRGTVLSLPADNPATTGTNEAEPAWFVFGVIIN